MLEWAAQAGVGPAFGRPASRPCPSVLVCVVVNVRSVHSFVSRACLSAPSHGPLVLRVRAGVHYGYGVQVGPNVPLNVHRLQYEPQLTRNDRLGGLGGGWKYQPLPPRNVFISICTSLACSLWTRSSIQKSTHFLWCSCFFWTQKENFLLDSRLVAPRGGACLLPATHLGCLTVMRCSFSSQCSGNNYLKNS